MSHSFEYIDIILLAMIAGFIFLRLRGILGKKTGFEKDINSRFNEKTSEVKTDVKLNFDSWAIPSRNLWLEKKLSFSLWTICLTPLNIGFWEQ